MNGLKVLIILIITPNSTSPNPVTQYSTHSSVCTSWASWWNRNSRIPATGPADFLHPYHPQHSSECWGPRQLWPGIPWHHRRSWTDVSVANRRRCPEGAGICPSYVPSLLHLPRLPAGIMRLEISRESGLEVTTKHRIYPVYTARMRLKSPFTPAVCWK
jgi:hypothetical protein